MNLDLNKLVLLKFTFDKSAFVKSVLMKSPPAISASGIFIWLKSFPENE